MENKLELIKKAVSSYTNNIGEHPNALKINLKTLNHLIAHYENCFNKKINRNNTHYFMGMKIIIDDDIPEDIFFVYFDKLFQ